jgi:hypothetical protein
MNNDFTGSGVSETSLGAIRLGQSLSQDFRNHFPAYDDHAPGLLELL